jgi:2-iminobutanoate/2-iminopropanoate deaminase
VRRALLRWMGLAVILGFSAAVLAQTKATETKKTESKQAPGKSESASGLKHVATEDAPKAIGPYSQGVVAGGFLFCAGQIPLDPKTGELVATGTEPATERVLDNLEAVLKAEGLTFADVVKTTVFLTKSEDFQPMNGVYGRRMGESKPARSTVFVVGLPRNASIEIEMIARAKR